MKKVTRDTIDGVRHYTDGTDAVMSVTTVLGYLNEDTGGLDYWKSQNDGEGNNPHHEHLFWYSGPRGTLCHYDVLSAYEDKFPFSEDMWGEEEADSSAAIFGGGPLDDDEFDNASYDERDIVYSLYKDRGIVTDRDEFDAFFDNITLEDVCTADRNYFTARFEEVAEDLGINEDSVVAVEAYVFEPELFVAGQADLIYEDPSGDTVLCDLKTSGSFRQKHRLQTVAYSKAVDADEELPSIDRIEVVRISPTKREVEVYSHEAPSHAEELDYYDTSDWFVDPYGEWDYDSLEDMWDKFGELVEKIQEEQKDA